MNIKNVCLKTNYMKEEYAIVPDSRPIFSWGASCGDNDTVQTAYQIKVEAHGELLWDSGYTESENQSAVYEGKQLPSGSLIDWSLVLYGKNGTKSCEYTSYFKTALLEGWSAEWIKSPNEKEHEVLYFRKKLNLEAIPERAVLYHAGIGLSKAYINTEALDCYRLRPLFTNYQKSVAYVTSIIDTSLLKEGENEIIIEVASGWRKNYGEYIGNMSEERKIEFMGDMLLTAQLDMYFGDIKTTYQTDESWTCLKGPVTYSHLFNGEIYDERKETLQDEVSAEFSDFKTNVVSEETEPVCIKREIEPVSVFSNKGIDIYDFGENISGVVRLLIKGHAKEGTKITLRHAEELDENGMLFCDTLRGAKAKDEYILKGGRCRVDHSPMFTYHGFRYVSLEVSGEFEGDIKASAYHLYTDLDTDGYFRCGNPLVNEIYSCAVRSERGNLHGIAEDCPQRDERMGWMNDATVRFPSMKYHFTAARLLEKIIGDIKNEQDSEGRITCTAPFLYGERPADPVCSSFLLAGLEHYMMTNSTKVIEKYYNSFVKWNEYLKSRRRDTLVDYSYYGDWAGPEDCCYIVTTIGNSDTEKSEEYDTGAANSKMIPGEMISTGCHYLNYTLLSEFAALLGYDEDKAKFESEAETVKRAYLEKWFNRENATVLNGSQACQAFSLYIGIIPEEYQNKAAQVMEKAVIDAGYRIETGNITTPMLMDMLTRFGMDDTAWKLLTRDEYPSWGYMIANGATTVWERFELKKDCGMNSHNHPMYGAVSGWLYRSLAGFMAITPLKKYKIAPKIPKDLLYFEMKIPLLASSFYLRCERKYEKLTVFVDVPLGMSAELIINGETYHLSAGFSCMSFDDVN